ncbi:protein-(glutamine-N5) methyltransferase [Lampropedia cohaerens]|uniref:Protein-(Glutamine-N5) methyltransferase n=2 Tax=Lampropedia cohaerens TaxID=1610491 RepID=A0A0U1Q1B6_9BURK|nr:protein-(glutamine-N5) methyltransferase [Lampropedia cohaerens]
MPASSDLPSALPTNLLQAVAQAAEMLTQAGVAFGHGTDNAWDEAAWLVLWQLGLPLDTDLQGAQGQQAINAAQWQAILALLARRIHERVPAAYLTGEAWLHGVPFYIDARSIVPRSLIAGPIVDGTLDIWLSDRTRRVLDLCTGNGSLAVLAALAWPDVTVDALDLSADALAVAAINVQRHDLQSRIRCIQSDALGALQPGVDCYDLVLCNPPYVNSQSMATLPAEYRAEPALALAGGDDGMDFIRPVLRQLPHFMTESAVLVLEVGHEAEHFERAFPDLVGHWLATPDGTRQVIVLERDALLQGIAQRP